QIWSEASFIRVEAESLKSESMDLDLFRSTVCGDGFIITGCMLRVRLGWLRYGVETRRRRVVSFYRGQWRV
ncbi:unnamed protein product, partial [Brassica rapa subsp. trilocularis]